MQRQAHNVLRLAVPVMILAGLLGAAEAQQTLEIRGKVVRTAPDQIILTTAQNKRVYG
jgi:hypothetical protein